MNKRDFERELKELMTTMSEEEIEKTISALSDCKSAVQKINDHKKSEKSRLLLEIECHEAELYYIGEGKKEGIIKTVGASLLTYYDFQQLKQKLPKTKENWWLHDKSLIRGDVNVRNELTYNKYGKIRPVIVIDDIQGKLVPGDVFYINEEKFQLLTPYLAIKSTCFGEECSYPSDSYERSILRFCVDGWYMKLINDNKMPDQ